MERIHGAAATLSAVARWWLSGVAASAGMLVAVCLPAPASAGTYYWPLPTAQAPGPANPDHDAYGARPWSYEELPIMTAPGGQSSPTLLGTYSTSIEGGLAGWYDAPDADQPFVAANRTSGMVGVVAPGELAIQPARDRVLAVAWTSPLARSQEVPVSGTLTAEDPDPSCLSRPTWTLVQNGTVLASGVATGGSGQAFSASPTVDPGHTVYLVVGWTGASYSQACVTAGLELLFQASSLTPKVTLERPVAGARIIAAQPTFSGHASSDFGDSSNITVRVFKGSSASGAVTERLSAKRAGTGYSVAALPPLANGTYTAVAEQDDAAGDVASSSPVAFSVHNLAPRPIGTGVSLDGAGRVSVPIGCPAASGTCTGDVLVLTASSFAPVSGGPRGPVRVLFAHVQVPAGSTLLVQRTVPAYVDATLRRHAPLRVRVSAALRDASGHQLGGSVVRMLRRAAPSAAKRG